MAAATRLTFAQQRQAACTKQQPQLQAQRHLQAPAAYLVSPQNQHVAPAAAGEVKPLRLGRNLELQVTVMTGYMQHTSHSSIVAS
jgi:hypothetical protein